MAAKFLELQSQLKAILLIPSKNRSDNEVKEYNRLRKKYTTEKLKYPNLVAESATATGAQRKAASRDRMTDEERGKAKTADKQRKYENR